MPLINGLQLAGEPRYRNIKEEGCAVSTQDASALEKRLGEHCARSPAPWTGGRPHPRIVNQLVGGHQNRVNL